MTDPLYNADFFIDPGIVKQEPNTEISSNLVTSASISIPRRTLDISDLRDFTIDLEGSNSPSTLTEGINSLDSQTGLMTQDIYFNGMSNAFWENKLNSVGNEALIEAKSDFKMDDDDIFQVDKADLIQGPTLAELNANDETLLGDLNFDDLLLPEEKSYYINVSPNPTQLQLKFITQPQQINNNTNVTNNNLFATSCPQNVFGFYKDSMEYSTSIPSSPYDQFSNAKISNTLTAFSPQQNNSHNSSTSSLGKSQTQSPPSAGTPSILQQKHSTLHELLLKNPAVDRSILGQSVPSGNSPIASTSGIIGPHRQRSHSSRLSSSAPTHLGLEQIWQRREPRKHLTSTSSLVEAQIGGSTSSLSTGGVLSPEAQDFSHDEGFDSEEDSEHYEDFSSDNDSEDERDNESPNRQQMTKKERFFWQYNVQAKGPKGQRLVLKTKMEDPHVLNEVTDPVFSPICAVRGIKHSGKARKGDGNDLTPNPRKLHNIGRELDKLGRIINDMTPVSELPFNVRPKTRKEKNKLASRACRLKKKAQHEANKIKLYGLEYEHKRLITGLSQVKQLVSVKLRESSTDNQEEINNHIEKITKSATKTKIAGHTTDYVNKILDKVKSGVPNGGLEEYQS